MHAPNRIVLLASLVAGILATTANGLNAQVGLQALNGNLWGAVVDMGVLEPVKLRWKWDGVGTPTRVVWQIATTTTTSTTSKSSDPEGLLRLPGKTGVYEPFTVTPPTGMRLPFYIHVRVENAGKAVYSRWITVRALARAAPVTSTSGALQPLTADPSPTAVATDDTPIRVTLTGIEAIRTARTGYDVAPLTTSGNPVSIDLVYAIAVSVEFTWSSFANSYVLIKSTPFVGMTSGQKSNVQIPIWGPFGAPVAIKGNGDNAAMMLAVMHRYQSPAIAIMEAVILAEIKNSLKQLAPSASPLANKEPLRLEMLAAFRRGLDKASAGATRPDRPVEMGALGVAKLVGGPLSMIGEELKAARTGQIVPSTMPFGNEINLGGQFRLYLEFRR